MTVKRHHWTPDEIQYLRDHVRGKSIRDLTDEFNAHFGLALSKASIQHKLSIYGMKNGLKNRFRLGNIPHNKGVKGYTNKGSNKPAPLGTESVKNGYVVIKVAQPNVWKHKDRIVWESIHGPIPKGGRIIFADGDKRNFAPENLICVTNPVVLMMKNGGLLTGDAEMTKVGISVAKIQLRIAELKRSGGRNCMGDMR